MKRIPIPRLSANIDEVTVTRWFKNVGDPVRRGEAVLEVTTDKAAFEIESPCDGELLATYAPEKSILPVGFTAALAGAPGEKDPEVETDNRRRIAAAAEGREASPEPGALAAVSTPPRKRPGGPAGRTRATPKARRLAREWNIDLAEVASENDRVVTESVLREWKTQRDAGSAVEISHGHAAVPAPTVAENRPGREAALPPIAWVTGGSRGIGRAIALALAGRGHPVAVHGFRHREAIDETVADILAAGGKALGITGDIADAEAVNRAYADIVAGLGEPLILVNAAGILRDQFLMLSAPRDWRETLAVNLDGPFFTMKCAQRAMMKNRWGRIINIGSVAGLTGDVMRASYCASKAGLQGLTLAAARELAGQGITVNLIAPGLVDTEMTAGLPEKKRARLLDSIPMGRFGAPREIAAVALFLAGGDAGYLTGETLVVDGGLYMRR